MLEHESADFPAPWFVDEPAAEIETHSIHAAVALAAAKEDAGPRLVQGSRMEIGRISLDKQGRKVGPSRPPQHILAARPRTTSLSRRIQTPSSGTGHPSARQFAFVPARLHSYGCIELHGRQNLPRHRTD